jgi:hypothetical protein
MKHQGHWHESERHSLQSHGIKTKKMNAKGNLGYAYEKDFTEHELLWDKVTPERLEELINNKDYEVIDLSNSTNSFGEFQFITLRKKSTNDFITFFGNGFHWARNRYITKYFDFYISHNMDYDGKEYEPLHKQDVLAELNNVRKSMEKQAKKFKRTSDAKTDKFEMIADEIGDEDFAYSETYM